MIITGVEITTVALPEHRVFRYRGGTIANKRVIVKLHTDSGLKGIGEATPIPTDWGHDYETIHLSIRRFIEPALLGMNPFHVEDIWQRLAGIVSIDQITQSLLIERAGVDVALYDLMGRAAGIPVHSLLGGAAFAKIPVAAVISLETPEVMAEIALAAQNAGYFDFKIKVGTEPQLDIARVQHIREVLGPSVQIRVDANGGWTPTEAVKLIRAMERFDLELVEQPVAGWDISGLAFVRRKVDTPIMVDESLHSVQDALTLVQAEACDFFNIKVQRLGGLTPARKILHIAQAAGIRCMLGGELESGVGTAAGLHLMAASNLFTIPGDLIGPLHFSDDILTKPFSVETGYLTVPTGPGLGVELDAKKMAHYAVLQSDAQVESQSASQEGA